ncbi:unnamed protein product [Aphanomyces euteiches]
MFTFQFTLPCPLRLGPPHEDGNTPSEHFASGYESSSSLRSSVKRGGKPKGRRSRKSDKKVKREMWPRMKRIAQSAYAQKFGKELGSSLYQEGVVQAINKFKMGDKQSSGYQQVITPYQYPASLPKIKASSGSVGVPKRAKRAMFRRVAKQVGETLYQEGVKKAGQVLTTPETIPPLPRTVTPNRIPAYSQSGQIGVPPKTKRFGF